MLPLVEGMPFALTDHIDRSPDKQLLRGKIGYLHSWILAKDESSSVVDGERVLQKLPEVVFLLFPGEKWKLPSLSVPGLYPIKPRGSMWFLDKGRKHPVLGVRRHQLPLAPAFAITAHASQGQTVLAAIVDMMIGYGSSPIGSYVAITRVKRRALLLIYRPFEHSLFTRGDLEGPALLLRKLRGDDIDWAEIERKHTPQKMCTGCGFKNFKPKFSLSQWNRKDERHFCVTCLKGMERAGTPMECTTCQQWKPANAFDEKNQLRHVYRTCIDCVETRQCIESAGV